MIDDLIQTLIKAIDRICHWLIDFSVDRGICSNHLLIHQFFSVVRMIDWFSNLSVGRSNWSKYWLITNLSVNRRFDQIVVYNNWFPRWPQQMIKLLTEKFISALIEAIDWLIDFSVDWSNWSNYQLINWFLALIEAQSPPGGTLVSTQTVA